MYVNGFPSHTAQADFTSATDMRDHVLVEGGYQPVLERDVVIRRLSPSADPRLRSRFLREVKTLAQLRHHGFVYVYDAGVKDDVPFAVFERLRGITAQHRIELLADRQARLELDEAVRIVENVARTVAYARRQGVYIYDLSPANIVVAEDKRVVLTGLGEPLPDNPLTAPATALAYAAPERLFDAPAEGDEVYGLGVLLAHLIFGRLPFEGSPISIIAQKQQLASLPVLSDPHAALACPYPLAALMHRATAGDPRERFAGVEQFEGALAQALSARGATGSSRARVYDVSPAVAPSYGAGWPTRPFVDEVAPAGIAWAAQPVVAVARSASAAPVAPAPTPPVAVVAAPATVASEPEPAQTAPAAATVVLAQAEATTPRPIDPLTPGFENPALAAALPFTVLVPMPDEEQLRASESVVTRPVIFTPRYVAVLLVLCILAIGAAVMFG